MSTIYHITDTPLAPNQDFNYLKEQALAYIQEKSGNNWSNLNASDPGITILDQVCYALTELGYCNDFDIRDILTKRDGKIHYKNQFYLPQDILTTSPVTIVDYRKFVIDGVSGVANVWIEVDASGCYQTLVLPSFPLLQKLAQTDNESVSGSVLNPAKLASDLLCDAVLYRINQARNIGEFFQRPVVLNPVPGLIQGSIEIQAPTLIIDIIIALQSKVCNFIFPDVREIKNAEETNSENFDGPRLNNLSCSEDDLGTIRTTLNLVDLYQLIDGIQGVTDFTLESFEADGVTQPFLEQTGVNLVYLDILESVKMSKLTFSCRGEMIHPEFMSSSGQNETIQVEIPGASGAVQYLNKTDYLHGKYREIDQYYSIQYTFPEIFGVGNYAVESGNDYQITLSRQLRGYLTLIDQLVVNQFAQLANLEQLFSFSNPMVATERDHKRFYALKSDFEKKHTVYPVPYEVFSPTYFYQSLYDVPFIRPLLKNYKTFDYSYQIEEPDHRDMASWNAYKQDPYNAYIHGLMMIMEDDQMALVRRNQMLDHLLARHGESPVTIDALIEGSVYCGNAAQDRVVFKSLYLQNLNLLSYYRNKAWNFFGALRINNPLLLDENYVSTGESDKSPYFDSDHDFIFNTDQVNDLEKLVEKDFIAYSALELKMRLLFGLRPVYKTYLSGRLEDLSYEDSDAQQRLVDGRRLVRWLLHERAGCILIETNLLKSNLAPQKGVPSVIFDYDVIVLFPGFVKPLNSKAFNEKVNYLLQRELPLGLTAALAYPDETLLMNVALAFTEYHNALIYDKPANQVANYLQISVIELVIALEQLTLIAVE